MQLAINGQTHTFDAQTDMPLLWVLRNVLRMTGTKFGCGMALCGARKPDQLSAVEAVGGWRLDANVKAQIDRMLRERIADPIGPEFMAPPARLAIDVERATA